VNKNELLFKRYAYLLELWSRGDLTASSLLQVRLSANRTNKAKSIIKD